MSTREDSLWFESLIASVRALGAAAHEYRAAALASRAAASITESAGPRPIDGRVAVPGSDPIRPRDQALARLGQLYGELHHRSDGLYENAAQAYAYGAAQALNAALYGRRPAHVELDHRDGIYVLPDHPLPDFGNLLARYPESHLLAGLRRRLAEYREVRRLADTYAFPRDLEGMRTLAMLEEKASELANCAYSYGETAEAILRRTVAGSFGLDMGEARS